MSTEENYSVHISKQEGDVIMAFSELFLDTSLEEYTVRNIQKVMNESGLPERQLKEIFIKDVSLHLLSNLKATAGEWNGFDRKWLLDKIEARRRLRRKIRIFNLLDSLRAKWTKRLLRDEIALIFLESIVKK